MNATFFLAQVLGLYCLIVGISLLINRATVISAAHAILNHQGLAFFSAIITLILGILLVVSDALWGAELVPIGIPGAEFSGLERLFFAWPAIIVTVLCWLVFIKGLVRVLWPGFDRLGLRWIENPIFYYVSAIVLLVLGLVLSAWGWGIIGFADMSEPFIA